MKNQIQLPLPKNIKLLVGCGDEITPQIPIYQENIDAASTILPLSTMLKVNPQNIAKFLIKKPGEIINKGEVIAKKKNLWSQVLVKSPKDGKIRDIDLKQGTLTISKNENNKNKSDKVYLPLAGKIDKITQQELVITTSCQIYQGEKGQGDDVIGNLSYIDGEKINLWNIDSNVSGKIILFQRAESFIFVKLEVLGALGLILSQFSDNIPLPYLQVNQENFAKLIKLDGSKIWLRPKSKEVILLN